MRSLKGKLSLLLFSLGFTSCASLQTVSLTQVPKSRVKPVEAKVEKFIFLAFNFDNNYLDPLKSELIEQCPGGRVSGILTKDEVISYVFAHKRIVTAKGYCVQ